MDYKEILKKIPPVSQAGELIRKFFEEQKEMYISFQEGGNAPVIDLVDYKYHEGNQYILISSDLRCEDLLESGQEISGLIVDGEGKKLGKKLYASYTCYEGEENPFLKKGRVLKLQMKKGLLVLNPFEMYDLDEEMNHSFASHTPSGVERFECSRHVVMYYLDRKVTFTCILEDGVYYTLAQADSHKIGYIEEGGICEMYDGRDIHFFTKINILDDTTEIYEKLKKTNNLFFKENRNLIALSFKEEA